MRNLSLRRSPRGFSYRDLAPRDVSFHDAFVEGLSGPEKSVPCRYLYDAEGSALFERITTLPDYYPTRAEISILKARAGELARLAGRDAQLVELGSGSSAKTELVLDRLEGAPAYVSVDVSESALRAAAARLADDYPHVDVTAICADYAADFVLPQARGRRVGFFPGSTIGNLERDEARALLALWRRRLGAAAVMIVGVDLLKDEKTLLAAYDDADGVTESFIKNILARANRELGGSFDLKAFAYEARWSRRARRVEMSLVSRARQRVAAAGREFVFEEGERIHVENSHKYAPDDFAALARAAGFSPRALWTDPEGLFSVHALAGPAP